MDDVAPSTFATGEKRDSWVADADLEEWHPIVISPTDIFHTFLSEHRRFRQKKKKSQQTEEAFSHSCGVHWQARKTISFKMNFKC